MMIKLQFILLLAIVSVSIGTTEAFIGLAQGLTITESNGNSEIGTILKSSETVPENGKLTVTIPVKQIGTEDTISVMLYTSTGVLIDSKTSPTPIKNGLSYNFVFDIYPTAVTSTTYYDITVQAKSGFNTGTSEFRYGVTDVTNLDTPIKESSGFDFILSVFSLSALLIIRVLKK